MSNPTTSVAGQPIPLDPTASDVAVLDPVVSALATYLAFWIRTELGAKGTQQRPAELSEVLPEANVFPFDPDKTWVRLPKPAFYLWWPKGAQSQFSDYSTTYDLRTRELRCMYVGPEVTAPSGQRIYSGLTAAIDAILGVASMRGRHPDYSPSNARQGTAVGLSVGDIGSFGWRYLGGKTDFAAQVPTTPIGATGGNASGYSVRGYPVLLGTLKVQERVQHDGFTADNLANDLGLTLNAIDEGDLVDAIPIRDGFVPGPDGTELE